MHQLRYALAVADERSFTAAARVLHVSQSGVSAQVALLERELGTRLFDRIPKGVRVVPTALPVIDQIRRVVTEFGRVHALADEINGLVSGAVSVGAVAGLTWPAFLDGLQAVHRRHPGLALSLREGNSHELHADVACGRLDLALVNTDRPLHSGLSSWIALDEVVSVAVGPGHPWTSRSRIEPRELLEQPVIALAEGTGMRHAYQAMMRAEGLPAPVTWEVTLPGTARALASRGLGVAVLTTSTADAPSDLHPLRIESTHTASRLGLVWRSEPQPSAGARAVLAALKQHLVGQNA